MTTTETAKDASFHGTPINARDFVDRHSVVVPIFVYGTLRKNHGNYRWFIQGNYDHCDEGVTTKGQIHWVFKRSGYPVAFFDTDGTIIGDIFWMPVDDLVAMMSLRSMDAMERDAGYRAVLVDVAVPGRDEPVGCMAWEYAYGRENVGDRIESGDWAKATYSRRSFS